MDRTLPLGSMALACTTLQAFLFFSVQHPTGASAQKANINTMVNLVVVEVLVQDKVTGMPVRDLRAEDFEVLDNGHPVEVSFFLNGSRSDLEPIALWLVAECPQKKRSTLLARDVDLLALALKHLHRHDTVGIAHWCEDQGEAQIALAPTADREAPVVALHTLFRQSPTEPHEHTTDRALLKLLRLIHSAKPSSDQAPRPVVVLLGSNSTAIPKDEAVRMAREVLSHTSLVLYNMREGIEPTVNLTSTQQVPLIRYISRETGGQVFPIKGGAAGETLEKIVARLRARYVIAYRPGPMDGKWHLLRIRLAKKAIRKYATAVLAYRSGYLNAVPSPRYSVSAKSREDENQLDSSLLRATESYATKTELSFEAEGATFEGETPARSARFTLELNGELLSWTSLPDEKNRSKMTVVTTFLSTQNEIIMQKVQQYEVTRSRTDAWTLSNQYFAVESYSDIPTNTDRVRFLIRDDATGQIGAQSLLIQEVLEAPRIQPTIR